MPPGVERNVMIDSGFLESRMKGQAKNRDILGLDTVSVEKYLPHSLERSVDRVISLYEGYNTKLPEDLRRPDADFIFLSNFYKSFLTDRNRRSEDVRTPKHKETAEFANNLLPMTTLEVLCMDGRVKLVHTNGFTADIGSSIRTPGGLLSEFVRKDGKLTLDKNSHFAQLILGAVKKSDSVAEVFDSHFGCAARTGEEAATGNYPDDSGLLRDVVHKKEMIEATREMLAGQKTTEGKNIALIQTSFNPVTGYMYMGLERDEALEYAREQARKTANENGKNPERAAKYAQYTKGVLHDLVVQGKIISTGALIADEKIKAALDKKSFPINRQTNYIESEAKFWANMADLKIELLPYVQEIVATLYPHLKKPEKSLQLELEERAMLLLTNTYNSYLHNPTHDVLRYLKMSDHEYESEQRYPYGIHNEEGVKVSEGGHPPYDIPMFVVYSEDVENLSSRIELASGLVRKNRLEGRISDRSGHYKDPEEFAGAPVPVIIQEIIKDENGTKITDEEWKKLEEIEWDDMPKEWNTMDDKDFAKYLVGKGIGSFLLINGVQNARRKMARIYDPSQETSSHLLDLYKTALPIICDDRRETHAIIPFVKVGREEAA